MAATKPEPVTWKLDTMMQTVTVAGTETPSHRILVNNRQAAFLYNRGSGTPVRKLTGAAFREVGGRWVVTGENESGESEEWSAPKIVKRGGCTSCGKGRR